jgi:hypothetical protein
VNTEGITISFSALPQPVSTTPNTQQKTVGKSKKAGTDFLCGCGTQNSNTTPPAAVEVRPIVIIQFCNNSAVSENPFRGLCCTSFPLRVSLRMIRTSGFFSSRKS